MNCEGRSELLLWCMVSGEIASSTLSGCCIEGGSPIRNCSLGVVGAVPYEGFLVLAAWVLKEGFELSPSSNTYAVLPESGGVRLWDCSSVRPFAPMDGPLPSNVGSSSFPTFCGWTCSKESFVEVFLKPSTEVSFEVTGATRFEEA